MIRPVAKLELYKYSISNISLYSDNFDEPILIPPIQLISLTIIKNYENNIVPLMLLSIHVKRDEYEKIITSSDTLTAEFTIYKLKTEESNGNDDRNNQNEYKIPYIKGKFKAYNKDIIDMRIPNQLKNSNDDLYNNTQNTLELDLYLYDHQTILKYNKNISYILNCTTNDILFTILKDRGFTNILMSPSTPNNTKNFIIPYGSLNENFNFIDEYYGIYDNPRLFFADFDVVYLLDKGNMNTLQKGELASTFMYLEKSEESVSIESGCYIDDENGRYILNASPFSVNDTGTIIDFNSAGKIRTMLSGTNNVYEDTVGVYDMEKAFIVNNPKSHNQLKFNINDTKKSMNIEFTDIDMSIITPNKRYTLIPDSFYDSNYDVKGDYRLTQSSIVLTRRTEDTIRSVIQCTFSKIIN